MGRFTLLNTSEHPLNDNPEMAMADYQLLPKFSAVLNVKLKIVNVEEEFTVDLLILRGSSHIVHTITLGGMRDIERCCGQFKNILIPANLLFQLVDQDEWSRIFGHVIAQRAGYRVHVDNRPSRGEVEFYLDFGTEGGRALSGTTSYAQAIKFLQLPEPEF